MANNIKVPNSAWHEQAIIVSGTVIRLIFKFNTADQSWYIDILDNSGNGILYGLKVMPNQNLTGRYNTLQNLPDGNLWCIRDKNDTSPVGRDNLGIGKAYNLVWYSSAEEEELGINGRVQL